MELSIQNWIVNKFDEPTQLKMLAEAGFTHLDWDLCRLNVGGVYSRETDEETEEYYSGLRSLADKLGLNIWMTHTIFPTYMEESSAERVFSAIKKCFMATNILGAKYTIVHPMMPRKWEGKENRKLRVEENIKFYNSLTPLAKEYKIEICIENMFGFPAGYGKYNETSCSRYEEMLEIYEGLSERDLFGFCYDSGHANLTYKRSHPDMITALGNKIKTVHLHDNNDKFDFHRIPYKGNLKWDEVMSKLKEVGFSGVYNFEISPIDLRGINKQKKLNKIHDFLEDFLKKYE